MTNIESTQSESNRLLDNGQLSAAIILLTNALASTPEAQLYNKRGIVFERLGEYEPALADYSAAIMLAPKTTQFYVSRGLLLSDRIGDGSAAISDFLAAFKLDPTSLIVHQHLSLCYLRNGDSVNAMVYGESAVAIGPGDYLSHFCLGESRLEKKMYQAAINSLQIATTLNPDSAFSWSALGRALAGLGNREKAAECYMKVITISPSAMSWIQLAGMQLDLGNADLALKSLESAKSFELTEGEQALVGGYSGIAAGGMLS